MILNLTDGKETVFLALILRAIVEEKPVSELMHLYSRSVKVTDVLARVREFAKAKLNHPDFAVVFEEIEHLKNPNDEGRKDNKNS